MRRRTQAAFVRPPRKRLVSQGEVVEELDAMLARMPEPTPEQVAASDRHHARFTRWQDKGRAMWDAFTPAERKNEADRMLADIRRRDSEADERDLGADGGREMYGIIYACDRDRKRREKKEERRSGAERDEERTAAEPVASATTVEVPAAITLPAEDDTAPDPDPKPRARRASRRAGLVAVIDPRLYDIEEEWT